jgi:transposase
VDTTQQGRERRRRYTLTFKRQVVEETLAGGESVSVVARRHDLNANLLFNWRRRYQQGTLSGAAGKSPALLPIRIASATAAKDVSGGGDGGAELELLLASGHRVRVRGTVEPAVLRTALEVLSR